MIKRLGEYWRRIFFVTPKVPRHVDIEISTNCNLNCKMCKRDTIDFGNQMMPYETFTKIMDNLPKGVELISFGGYGEMMMHPKFCDMVKYAKEKGHEVQTTSNGTLLATDERMISVLESGIDTLRISIDHVREPEEEKDVGHVFSERLLKDLKRLNELRTQGNYKIKLGINTVVHKGNIGEIIDIIKCAEDLGFDLVELIRLDLCKNRLERKLTLEKEKEVYGEVERMKKKIKVVTPANRFAKWKRLYNMNHDFCIFRLHTAHVRMNGAVSPCAVGFAVHDFGNIHEKSLKEIWNNEKFKKVHATAKNPVCQNCSIFKWGKSAEKSSQLPIIQ